MVHLKMDHPPRHGGVGKRPGLSRQQVPILAPLTVVVVSPELSPACV